METGPGERSPNLRSPTRRRTTTPTTTSIARFPDEVWIEFLAPYVGAQQIALSRLVSKFMNAIVWQKLTLSGGQKNWVTSLRIRSATMRLHHRIHCFDESMR